MPVSTRIYTSGALAFGGQPAINEVLAAGYSTVLIWSVHVAANGDLSLNDTYFVSGGRYAEVQPMYLPATVAQLKAAGVQVLFSVGSGFDPVKGPFDFRNIAALLNGVVPGPGNPLYDNFAALRRAMRAAGGDIDGVDFDNEDNMDASVMVNFARMLANIGYGNVTFCPYDSEQVWLNALAQLNQNPGVGFVNAVHLQCYSGGGGNADPNIVQGWQDLIANAGSAGRTLLIPGLATTQPGAGPWWWVDDNGVGHIGDNVRTTPGVAMDGQADWSKLLHILNYPPDNNAALRGAQSLGGATFFFYCNAAVDLGPGKRFVPGDAVFFAGQPAWRAVPQCTASALLGPCSDIYNPPGVGACPPNIEQRYRLWSAIRTPPQGGFIWLYDSVVDCILTGGCSGTGQDPATTAKAYRDAIENGLTPGG